MTVQKPPTKEELDAVVAAACEHGYERGLRDAQALAQNTLAEVRKLLISRDKSTTAAQRALAHNTVQVLEGYVAALSKMMAPGVVVDEQLPGGERVEGLTVGERYYEVCATATGLPPGDTSGMSLNSSSTWVRVDGGEWQASPERSHHMTLRRICAGEIHVMPDGKVGVR